jgi:hypothetical protein
MRHRAVTAVPRYYSGTAAAPSQLSRAGAGTRAECEEGLMQPRVLRRGALPDYSDHWPPRLPEHAIVIDQLRGWQPGAPPSLAELLETGRTRQPEPDLEAEP